MHTAQIVLGLVFGAIGLTYFMYGKKCKNMVIRYTGLGLMIYPYFIDGTALTILVGLVLMALPKIYGRYS